MAESRPEMQNVDWWFLVKLQQRWYLYSNSFFFFSFFVLKKNTTLTQHSVNSIVEYRDMTIVLQVISPILQSSIPFNKRQIFSNSVYLPSIDRLSSLLSNNNLSFLRKQSKSTTFTLTCSAANASTAATNQVSKTFNKSINQSIKINQLINLSLCMYICICILAYLMIYLVTREIIVLLTAILYQMILFQFQ